jgi:hypothetical protein
MCTLIISRDSTSAWPVVIAANRDEMAGRAALSPGRHWPDRPEVVAGRDVLAGGSWLGINHTGVVAAILNRVGTLGPAPDKRSRGELVLEALDHGDAVDAADALSHLDGRAWRPFNMVLADNRDAFWVRSEGRARVEVMPVPEGVHMLTALDLDAGQSPRVGAYLPRFRAAPRPAPAVSEWAAWAALMADAGAGPDGEEAAAMCFTRDTGFGTVSSSLIALPEIGADRPPVWLFAAGRPDGTPYVAVDMV